MNSLVLAVALKGTVTLALAWAVTALLRRKSADLRHRVWLAGLASLLLLAIPLRMPETAQVTFTYTVGASSAAAPVESNGLPVWQMVWGAIAGLLLLRFGMGVLRLQWITSQARLGGAKGIRVSGAVSSPMTWGVVRPIILVPAYSESWTEEERACALRHERIHIARHDWLWQSLAQLLCAVFWFHPLVWLAASRLRREAEHAVDDAMVESGAPAASYAEQLLDVARRMRAPETTMAVAMVGRPELSARIAAILDGSRVRTRASLRVRWAILVLASALVPVLAAFQARPVTREVVPVRTPQRAPIQVQPAPRAVRPQSARRASPVIVAQARPVPAPTPPAATPGPVYPIGDGVTAPIATYTPEPEYTEAARDAHLNGEVLLSVVIDEAGLATNIKVTRALGLGLDESAIETLKKWRFKPGFKDGMPVAVRATISVQFHLR